MKETCPKGNGPLVSKGIVLRVRENFPGLRSGRNYDIKAFADIEHADYKRLNTIAGCEILRVLDTRDYWPEPSRERVVLSMCESCGNRVVVRLVNTAFTKSAA